MNLIFSSFVLSHNAEVHATSRRTHGWGYTPSHLRTEQEPIDVRPSYGVHSHSHRSLSRHWLRFVCVLHCVIVSQFSAHIISQYHLLCRTARLVEAKSNKPISTTRNNNVTMQYGTRTPNGRWYSTFSTFTNSQVILFSHTNSTQRLYSSAWRVNCHHLPVILRVAESHNFHV
jgi:hypothetical protein